SCLLLFRIVRPYFGDASALAASLFLATDLMLGISNFEAMAEPLFVLLVLASVYYVVPALVGVGQSEVGGKGRLAVGGFFLGLAILTRPAALYLPAVLVLSALALGFRRKGVVDGLTRALVILATSLP